MSVILPVGANSIIAPGFPQTRLPVNFAVPDGLVGYWGFDEDCLDFSNNRALDLSGNRNHGTLTGITSAALASGKIQQALNLNGSSQYIRVPSSASLQGFAESSYCAWVNVGAISDSNGACIVAKPTTDGGASNPFELYTVVINQARTVFFGLSTGVSGSRVSVTSVGTIPTSLWTFVCATHDGVTIRICINDKFDPNTATFATSVGTNSIDLRLGAFLSQSVNEYFPGILDDVRIYNRALSPWEIIQLYKAGLAGRRDAGQQVPQSAEVGMM